MSDSHGDSSANTAQFQAYAQRTEPEPARRSYVVPLVIAAAVVLVAVAGILFVVTR